jgi:hypothetical protein
MSIYVHRYSVEPAIQEWEKDKMSTKFFRFIVALVFIVSVFGNTGFVRADRGALPGTGSQNIDTSTLPSVAAQRPPRAPEARPLDLPALTIPPASSLGVQFVHVATAANSAGDWTTIDHPLTNGKPGAILIVTPNWNPGNVGGVYDNHPIGVFYTGTQWAIFNQDLTAIPVGAAFNVIIPTAAAGVFVHTANVGNSSGDLTTIDNVLTNGNPNALVFVTQNWNPGGVGGTYNSHPIGAYYDGSKWGIFNQDLAVMPAGAAFNVTILTAGTGIFVHTATAGNSAGDYTNIDNPLTNGNPNAIVFVTPNRDPGGVGGTPNNHNIGVWYNSTASKWAIFNQDLTAIPVNAAFNVLVLVPASDIFVHKATAGNSSSDQTQIDNALTNGHPNAIIFTTPNWNPVGIGGTYNNHNIGVYYFGSAERIFNQDTTPIPVNAAFNVLIPNPDTSVFVHVATAGNSAGDYTIIDNPLTNSKPDAIILVTPNWNPGGVVGGIYDNHPIGVFYNGSKWAIFNQDLTAVPVNAAFNVTVPKAGPGVGVFVHTASASNSGNDYTRIDNALTNGNPNAIVIVTQNWNPGGAGGTYNSHAIGVWYTGSKWAIFNQDIAAIPVNAAFNVYVFANYRTYLPLITR